MLAKLAISWVVMALCVSIHAVWVVSALRWLRRRPDPGPRFWHRTWKFICIAGWMVLCHLIEIALWAWLFYAKGAMPDMRSSIYFSAVTYTTTGYGDIVLPVEWRLLGGVEALTGILMCGWSSGFFFAVVSRMLERETAALTTEERMTIKEEL